MILDFEKKQYQEMILQGKWEELAAVMDRRLKQYLLALSAQVMDYENLHEEYLRSSKELLTEVLDPEGGSMGFTYDYTADAWEKLQQDRELRTKEEEMARYRGYQACDKDSADGSQSLPENEERFLHAMAVCHIPLHLLAVIPDSIPQPLPFHAGLAWVMAEEEEQKALAAGYEGVLAGENGVEAHLQITSEGSRASHPSAGEYTAFDAEGYVTGYTMAQPRPLRVELYDAYPEDVMVRFAAMPADEYEYRRHWEAYFRWQEDTEGMIRSEIDRELSRVSAMMEVGSRQGMPGGYGQRGRDERSYDNGDSGYGYSGYGQARPGSFGYDGSGAGSYGGYNGSYGGGYNGSYGGGYNGAGGYGGGYNGGV